MYVDHHTLTNSIHLFMVYLLSRGTMSFENLPLNMNVSIKCLLFIIHYTLFYNSSWKHTRVRLHSRLRPRLRLRLGFKTHYVRQNCPQCIEKVMKQREYYILT